MRTRCDGEEMFLPNIGGAVEQHTEKYVAQNSLLRRDVDIEAFVISRLFIFRDLNKNLKLCRCSAFPGRVVVLLPKPCCLQHDEDVSLYQTL